MRRTAIALLLGLVAALACSLGSLSGRTQSSQRNSNAYLRSLADIQLTTASGARVSGTVIDICEPSGCVGEQVPPTFGPGDFSLLPATPGVQLTFMGSLPQEVTLALLRDDQGYGTFAQRIDTMTAMPTGANLNWHFAADAGRYVIEVQGIFDTGHAVYVWFPVEVSP